MSMDKGEYNRMANRTECDQDKAAARYNAGKLGGKKRLWAQEEYGNQIDPWSFGVDR